MQANITRDGETATIKLSGRFDFNAHRDFRSAYGPLVADSIIREVKVDFDGVDYLDSSALGMLLMLRDKMNGASKEVSLSNAKGSIRQVLDVANFGKLFKIA